MSKVMEMSPVEAAELLIKLSDNVKELQHNVNILMTEREMNGPDDKLVGLNSVCSFLNLSDRQIYRYRSWGILESVKVGKKVMFRAGDVRQFLNEYVLTGKLNQIVYQKRHNKL